MVHLRLTGAAVRGTENATCQRRFSRRWRVRGLVLVATSSKCRIRTPASLPIKRLYLSAPESAVRHRTRGRATSSCSTWPPTHPRIDALLGFRDRRREARPRVRCDMDGRWCSITRSCRRYSGVTVWTPRAVYASPPPRGVGNLCFVGRSQPLSWRRVRDLRRVPSMFRRRAGMRGLPEIVSSARFATQAGGTWSSLSIHIAAESRLGRIRWMLLDTEHSPTE